VTKNPSLGERSPQALQYLRECAALTPHQAEKRLRKGALPEIERDTVRAWESGERAPDALELIRYLEVLGASFHDFSKALAGEALEDKNRVCGLEIALAAAGQRCVLCGGESPVGFAGFLGAPGRERQRLCNQCLSQQSPLLSMLLGVGELCYEVGKRGSGSEALEELVQTARAFQQQVEHLFTGKHGPRRELLETLGATGSADGERFIL
jgi:transcriptional regulator with XRE-family HTH domain